MAKRIFTFTLENKARISIGAEDIFKAIRQVPKAFHGDIVKVDSYKTAAGHKKARLDGPGKSLTTKGKST
jgi:hypothetical protein